MKIKHLAAAAALVACSAGAWADSVVGFNGTAGMYQSVYTFSLTGPGTVWGDVDLAGNTLAVSVSLFGPATGFDSDAADGFSFAGLSAGSYTLAFNAYGSGAGAFGGSYNVTAVPEPETYALMLAGLGMVGFIAARRRG